jgi:hypothetical protein
MAAKTPKAKLYPTWLNLLELYLYTYNLKDKHMVSKDSKH